MKSPYFNLNCAKSVSATVEVICTWSSGMDDPNDLQFVNTRPRRHNRIQTVSPDDDLIDLKNSFNSSWQKIDSMTDVNTSTLQNLNGSLIDTNDTHDLILRLTKQQQLMLDFLTIAQTTPNNPCCMQAANQALQDRVAALESKVVALESRLESLLSSQTNVSVTAPDTSVNPIADPPNLTKEDLIPHSPVNSHRSADRSTGSVGEPAFADNTKDKTADSLSGENASPLIIVLHSEKAPATPATDESSTGLASPSRSGDQPGHGADVANEVLARTEGASATPATDVSSAGLVSPPPSGDTPKTTLSWANIAKTGPHTGDDVPKSSQTEKSNAQIQPKVKKGKDRAKLKRTEEVKKSDQPKAIPTQTASSQGSRRGSQRFVTGSKRTGSLEAVRRRRAVFVTRLSPSTTAAEVGRHLEDLSLDLLVCSRLKTSFNSYSSFHVQVFAEDFERVFSVDAWPQGALISESFGPLREERIATPHDVFNRKLGNSQPA